MTRAKKTTGRDIVSAAKTKNKGKDKAAGSSKPSGRPSDYSDAIAATICDALIEGKSLRKICEAENMPSRTSVFRWLESNECFRDQYARARTMQAEGLFDELIDIVDDAATPLLVDGLPLIKADGTPVMIVTKEAINHARLKMDIRKWAASKLLPKKYGDRIDLSGLDNDAVLNLMREFASKVSA